MGHYIDIRLRRDPELARAHLLAPLYGRLHQALAEMQTHVIAVSFPDYDEHRRMLGERLRLCGPQTALAQLQARPWLNSLRDHVAVSEVQRVPDHSAHRALRRVQVKSNPERLRRRLMKRHQLTEEQARQRIPDSLACHTALPFVSLTSVSTGQHFPLFLKLGPARPEPCAGIFNSYGLSATATVPWF